jgi:aminoglycoside phosphotransferase family enzyme/predicted kinase
MTDLIEALRNPHCYPHPVDCLHIVETHISWIVLTGPYAYKIKKPVNLGFLDFGTLEARRFYCEEELRLNRRLAADLYLEVVAITGSSERPKIGGREPVLEYAVKMRQFREDGLLDRVQARGELRPWHIDALAQQIASFHQSCERTPAGATLGSPENILQPARQNFEQALELVADPADRARVKRLREWNESTGLALQAAFGDRQRDGFVRECHGDLHLGNVFLENEAIRIFDCIEFNANLRWIDVMNEIAFLVMDLWHRDHADLARRFLNAYLERAGDYAGLATLRFYLVYRAMVRAKVALIRSAQPDVSGEERQLDQSEFRRFIGLAEGFSARQSLWIVLTHGVSGSGKSYFAQRLLERCDAIRIRSDVERKRSHGLGREAASGSPIDAGLYAEAATRQTYERLAMLTSIILDAGWPVIADATFVERWQRDLFRALALRRRMPWLILDFRVADATRRKRIAERADRGADPSEATVAVLEHQIRLDQPLGDDERAGALEIDACGEPGPDSTLHFLNDLTRADRAQR